MEQEQSSQTQGSHTKTEETKQEQKRLFRSTTNKTISGIFGGIGEYYNIDATILRLAWILITVFSGFVPGILAYVIAIFVVPERIQKSS